MITRILVFCTLAFYASQAWSYRPIDSEIEQKILNSDVVVIGKVIYFSRDGYDNKISLLPGLVLKGEHADLYQVEFNSRAPELRPDCCRQGDMYIFYLKKWTDNVFHPLSGKFGIVRINNPEVKDDGVVSDPLSR